MTSATHAIFGRELRYRLTLLMVSASAPMSVREIAESLANEDHLIVGRPSKTISDALRWEIRRRRVRRVGRGLYVIDHIPPSTVRWMRGWLERGALSSVA